MNTTTHTPIASLDAEATVHIDHVKLIVQFLHTKGAQPDTVYCAEQCNLLAACQKNDAMPQMALTQFADLLKTLIAYYQDATIPFQLAGLLRTEHLGVLGYLLHATATLGEALLVLQRYGKIYASPVDNIEVTMLDDQLHLRWKNKDRHAEVAEFAMALLVLFAYQLVDHTALDANLWKMICINFDHPASAPVQAYQQYVQAQIHYGSAYLGVSMPVQLLQLPIRSPDAVLLRILQAQADQVLATLPQSSSLLHVAQHHLAFLCQQGTDHATLQNLAKTMHYSTRTLQRLFSAQHTTFKQQLDITRQQLSQNFLDKDYPLIEVASLLGYSDQSAFTRAYKRWTGHTPKIAQKRSAGK